MKTAFKLTTLASVVAMSVALAGPAFAWDPASPAGPGADAVDVASVGIVDTVKGGAVNEGVALIDRTGVQQVADISLAVPNTFGIDDIIKLDLSVAKADGSAGTANALKFSGTPTVTLVGSYEPTLAVRALSSEAGGTESSALPATKPIVGTAPAPQVALNATQSGLELKFPNGYPSPINGVKWYFKLSNVKIVHAAALAVTDDRVHVTASAAGAGTPFLAAAAAPTATGATPGSATQTVVARYKAAMNPVITVANPTLTADGTDQNLGDFKITEATAADFGANLSAMDAATFDLTFPSDMTLVNPADVKCDLVDATGTKVTGTSCEPSYTPGGPEKLTATLTAAGATRPADKLSIVFKSVWAKSGAGTNKDVKVVATSSVTGLFTPKQSPLTDTVAPAGYTQNDLADPWSGNDIATVQLRMNQDRVGGLTRYDVAAGLVAKNFSAQKLDMIVAAGDDAALADALSSGYLARSLGNAPLMLTPRDKMWKDIPTQAHRLGVNRIIIVGGAVSKAVEDEIRAIPAYVDAADPQNTRQMIVERVGGLSRFEVNQNANTRAHAANKSTTGTTLRKYGEAKKRTAILANGFKYLDALTATPLITGDSTVTTSAGDLPLVISEGDKLTATAAQQLGSMDVERVLLVGGEMSATPALVADIEKMGIVVDRIGGANRYEVAANLVKFAMKDIASATVSDGGLGWGTYTNGVLDGANGAVLDKLGYFSYGMAPADALTAGANGFSNGRANIVYISDKPNLSTETGLALKGNAKAVDQLMAVGGTVSVPISLLQQGRNAIAAGAAARKAVK